MRELKDAIRAFVVDNFLYGDDENLDDNSSFLEEGIIDSTGILELVTHLEETYKIFVEDEELVPENLDSIAKVLRYILKKNGDKNDFFHNSFRH